MLLFLHFSYTHVALFDRYHWLEKYNVPYGLQYKERNKLLFGSDRKIIVVVFNQNRTDISETQVGVYTSTFY